MPVQQQAAPGSALYMHFGPKKVKDLLGNGNSPRKVEPAAVLAAAVDVHVESGPRGIRLDKALKVTFLLTSIHQVPSLRL